MPPPPALESACCSIRSIHSPLQRFALELAGTAITAIFPENSATIASGVGLASAWQLIVGALLLLRSATRW